MNLRTLAAFLHGPLLIVTPRGVELPSPAPGWDAVDIASLCGQIEALPETPDRDGWSRRVER